jgi:hypothetical protein
MTHICYIIYTLHDVKIYSLFFFYFVRFLRTSEVGGVLVSVKYRVVKCGKIVHLFLRPESVRAHRGRYPLRRDSCVSQRIEARPSVYQAQNLHAEFSYCCMHIDEPVYCSSIGGDHQLLQSIGYLMTH